MDFTTIAKVNNVDILIINTGAKLVPIKPVCDALGVSYSRQLKKVKDDPILSSTLALRATVAKDGNSRDMQCIPHMFVFGWLFTINPKNVSPDIRETMLKYRMECYKALYYHFTAHAEFLEQKQVLLEEQMLDIQELKKNFRLAKDNLSVAEKKLKEVREMRFEDWDAERRQMKMNFEE